MIAVDIDGVVADSEQFIVEEIEKRMGAPIQFGKPRRYDFDHNLPISELQECYAKVIVKHKDIIEPHDYTRTLTALKMMQAEYGLVLFLTARAIGKVEEVTHYWIKKNFEGLKYVLVCLGDQSKKQWMVDNGFDTIIEDRFKTANEINFPDGNTFLINREWNEGRKEEPHVIRVKDLLEAVEIHMKSL